MRNDLAVSLEGAKEFENYIQVMAIFTSSRFSDAEGYERFFRVRDHFLNDPAVLDGTVSPFDPGKPGKRRFLFSVEDARITEGIPDRVNELKNAGVRILTPLWGGESCIGGAHDTSAGLTDAGKAVVARALSLGMIADISHASEASADDIFTLCDDAGLPCIASHSCAYDICPVSRNLRRSQIRNLLAGGGLIGLNLYHPFLKSDGSAGMEDLLRHIDFFFEEGAANALCLGCDFDGGAPLDEIHDLAALPRLADAMLRHGYSESDVSAVFFENAYRFAVRYLG